MARIEYIRHRLDNWARWKARESGGGLGYASQAAFLNERVDRYREVAIPVDDVEAGITDQGVQALKHADPDLHKTLHLYYLGRDAGSARRIGLQLGRDPSTIHAQLERCDRWISQWLRERQARQDEQRRAMEGSFTP